MDTAGVVTDILTHHGVKGMRWGVRRRATVDAREVVVSDKRKKLKTSGGKGLPAHPDAVRVRVTGQKFKGSGLKAVSDQELQAYTKRLNLEQSAKRLAYHDMNAAQKFVASLLGKAGKTAAQEAANQAASHQVKKHLTSRLIKTAAAAA